jgi:hypothetical protein
MSKSTVFTSLQARCTSAGAGYYVRKHYRVVGGVVVPVNRLELLALRLGSGQASWLGLAALASLTALTIGLVRRRKTITK